MSFSLAEARFLFDRAFGLARRGLASLRTRGWRASWERVKAQFHRVPVHHRATPYFPAEGSSVFAVPSDPAPTASIVVPVYNQVAHTIACLRALAEHPPEASCEIIVVDDGSADGTLRLLPQIGGLRYHRRASNGGFIAACNDGAVLARGEYLVFLNNDTIPQPGWLDALLRVFDNDPDVGLAGSQLLYPDGRLQEAGGVVFSDGSAWNYGKFESPYDPRYAYLRVADYCSGAAIAIPRELFRSLGGFSQAYAPAYYEDTDLAFAVRDAGKRTVYQPDSQVVHVEGATAGRDTHSGAKAYQAKNCAKFFARWHDALAKQLPPGTVPTPALLHREQRQILVVDALTPTPDRDSGSLRLINLMRLLQQEGAHVVFLPADLKQCGRYTQALQRMGVETWYAPYSGSAPAWFRANGGRFDAVMLSRHYVASEFLPLVREHAPRAKVIFDTVDLHYLRDARGADLSGDRSASNRARATRKRELDIIGRSDVTFVVSEAERELLAKDAPAAAVELVSNLHARTDAGRSFGQRRDLVFVGGFRHPPNVDAVLWFADEVFPLIIGKLPEVRFHCIGADPPAAVSRLAQRKGVLVHGHVPDIDPYMDGARIGLAPLRYGAGVKGKVNLSMAHGQPVVATPCAVEGMHLRDGHDVLVAESAEDFAAAVLRLYEDEALWETLSRNGLDNVARHFSPDAARETVRRVFFSDRR
ncbi:MAG TPA: glycosyltransferase [Luteimonas sp.]|nr:glycosyltransferase [Luteimonas sp.]